MKGYVFVDAPGLRTQRSLASWVRQCIDFVSTLAPQENVTGTHEKRPRQNRVR
jgi:hypothetical protein